MKFRLKDLSKMISGILVKKMIEPDWDKPVKSKEKLLKQTPSLSDAMHGKPANDIKPKQEATAPVESQPSQPKPFKPGKFSASHAFKYDFADLHSMLTTPGHKESGYTAYEPHQVHMGNGFDRKKYKEPDFKIVTRTHKEGTGEERPIHFIYKMKQEFPKQ